MPPERPHLVIEAPIEAKERSYPGGGGGGTYPRADYAAHSSKVYAEAQGIVASSTESKDSAATNRRYYRVRVPSDTSVWSSTGHSLSEALHSRILGAPDRHVAHLGTTKQSLSLTLEQLARYAAPGHVGKSSFAVVEEIGAIPLEEKISARAMRILESPDAKVTVLLSLFADLSNSEKQAVTRAIRETLEAFGGEIESTTEVESGVYLRASAKAGIIKDVAGTFLTVQGVDPVEYTLELASTPGETVPPDLKVLPNSSSAIAGIFDSGVVKGSRFMDDSLVDHEEPLGPPFKVDHGTFVASRIVYGDSLRDQFAAGQLSPDVKVLDVCTATADDLGNRKSASTEELMRIVRETVRRWHKQIRVFNISQNLFPTDLTQDPTVPDDVVSPLAAELDQLARRYEVLFVVTAGNYPRPGAPPPPTAYPKHFESDETRVVPPAEAMLALTVGSIAHVGNTGSLAPAGSPSPFTRRGPGFAGFRKPDLVAHGGNFGKNWQQVNDLGTTAIGSHGDRLCYGSGTSYSAPLVTRLAARLFDAIPGATPTLVRALLIHFAETPDCPGIPGIDRLVGNGSPAADRLLEGSQWQQGFVHVGTIPHREIRRIGFYVPSELCSRGGRRRVRIRATVVSAPETQRTLKAGYCKSHIRCKLSKRDGSGTPKAVNPDESSDTMKDRYAALARLDKTFSQNIAGGEWELLMEHESRWNLKDPSLPVAAVITVEDPREDPEVDVLSMIRNEVPNRYTLSLATPAKIRI